MRHHHVAHRIRAIAGAALAALLVVAGVLIAGDAAKAEAAPVIVINEVESNGGDPADWVELTNVGGDPVDVGGWILKDDNDSRTKSIPAGTTIAPGEYLVVVVDEGPDGFGLGGADSARLFLADGVTLVDGTSWTNHAEHTWGRCPDGTGAFAGTTASTKGVANTCGAAPDPEPEPEPGPEPGAPLSIRINEVESNGGTPGDWIELVNLDADHDADLTGWRIRDDDASHTAVPFPAGTTIESGGYLVIEEAFLGFGLGSGDSVILYAADGATVVDQTTWPGHASVTWARCPDGTGEFRVSTSSTKGLANDCSDPGEGSGDDDVEPWPGGTTMTAVPTDVPFDGDLSGLEYEVLPDGDPVLWAVTNGTGVLSKLVPGSGGAWNAADGWGAGKQLAYPDGSTAPDSEGVTVADGGSAGGVYVATERSSAANSTSRPSILRFDVSGPGTTLVATHEWNLAADLVPTVGTIGANSGLEGITWVPDVVLTDRGFRDESTGEPYDPARYPGHGGGVFFVALEATGDVYGYVLDLDGDGYTRVATIDTPGAMEVEFEEETQLLWAVCDEACNGRTATFQIGASGAYELTHRYARPAEAPDYANEGFAIAPQSACDGGLKPVYYADDANTDGVSLRASTIRCTPLAGGEPGGGEPGGQPGGVPGDGGSTTPRTPAESELTSANRGGVSGPATARAGSVITVTVGTAHTGEPVDGWVFSTPAHLGTRLVSAAGTVQLRLPATLTPGAHRVAVLDADGDLIGWFALTVTPAALGATGADSAATSAGVALAAGLLLVGGSLVAARRWSSRKAGSRVPA